MSGQGRDKGGGKTRGGGGSIKITKTKERKTKELDEKIIHLRKAVFAENGKDKDITVGIAPAFLKFDRNGLNVDISFSARLTEDEEDWAFDIVKSNMEEVYDSSGYGWDDDDKIKELTEDGTRFLLVREKQLNFDDTPGRLVAFAHFRFTIQGEVMDVMVGETSLHVWDIHVEDSYQRKGLGKHLLTLMELIARREKMRMISIPIQLNDERSATWIKKMGKGFSPDQTLRELVGFDAEMEGFEVYAKVLEAPVPRTPLTATAAVPVAVSVSAPVPASVAKEVAVVAMTPDKSVKIDTPSPTSVSEAIEEPMLDTTATATHATTLFDSEDDWQVVTKKDFCDGDSSTESKDGNFEESSAEIEDIEEPTEVEADLIDQIRAMFMEQSGRKATVFEEKEWLKNIRDVTEKVDEEEEVTI